MSIHVPAAKMNGLGNAILIMDRRGQAARPEQKETIITAELVRRLARQPQTAFDQLMVLYDREGPAPDAAYKVVIWNCDGTQAKACGNGSRCLAEYLWRQEPQGSKAGAVFAFATAGGLVTAVRRADGAITVTMGKARFDPAAVPLALSPAPADMVYVPLAALLPPGRAAPDYISLFPASAAVLSVGNPHAVFFLPAAAVRPIAALPLAEFGALLEHSPVFPQGVNVSLAQITAPDTITLRVWERGAGLTKACGTAACAAAVAARARGLAGGERAGQKPGAAAITVSLPGGRLIITLAADGQCRLTGPAEWEYAGFIALPGAEFHRHQAD